jgi:hypothetical protein
MSDTERGLLIVHLSLYAKIIRLIFDLSRFYPSKPFSVNVGFPMFFSPDLLNWSEIIFLRLSFKTEQVQDIFKCSVENLVHD